MRYLSFFILLILSLSLNGYCQDKNSKIQTIKERVNKFKLSDIKETTAIAGVRGAENEKGEELFWAGKDSVKKEELESFKIIIDKSEKGDTEGAKKDIEMFLIKYPNSALAKDALDLFSILKSE